MILTTSNIKGFFILCCYSDKVWRNRTLNICLRIVCDIDIIIFYRMRNCLGSLNCEAYANNVRQLKKDNSIFSLLMHASGFALAICNF